MVQLKKTLVVVVVQVAFALLPRKEAVVAMREDTEPAKASAEKMTKLRQNVFFLCATMRLALATHYLFCCGLGDFWGQ